MSLPNDSQATFIQCTFSMLAKLVAADGSVREPETRRVQTYIDNTLRLDRKTKRLALQVFNEALNAPLEMRDYAERLNVAFRDRVHVLGSVVEILLEVAVVDGQLHEREDAILRSAALQLGLSDPGYERLKRERLAQL